MWWAIDEQGCVAAFESDDHALVPKAAEAQLFDRFGLDALCAARAIAIGRRPPPRTVAAYAEHALAIVDPELARQSYRATRQESSFEAALAPEARWILRESAPRVIASSAPLTFAVRAALERDPTVVRVLDDHALRAWVDAERDAGLFRFRASAAHPTRFVRSATPTDSIRIHELDAATRDAIRRVRFPLSFERESVIVLDDHFPVVARVKAPRRGPLPTSTETRRERRRIGIALSAAVAVHVLLAWLLR